MLTTFFLLSFLVSTNATPSEVPMLHDGYHVYLISSSPEGRRLDNLIAEYQALPPEGQSLFAQKLKSVQDAVQQSDQATQDYQNTINDARNSPPKPNDPQAVRQKTKQIQDLGRTAANLKKVATDQISQLSAEMSSYRRNAQRSLNKNRSRDAASQQPIPMQPGMQPSFNPPFDTSPPQGFPPGQPSVRGIPPQPSGTVSPRGFPSQQQPQPGQYGQQFPPFNSGGPQGYPPQPPAYQDPNQQYGNAPYPDPYSQQQPYPGQYDPQQYPVSNYPPQGADPGYGANQPYPPQTVPPDVQKRSAKDETMQQVIQGVFGFMNKALSQPPPAPPGPQQAPSGGDPAAGQESSGGR